MNNGKRFPEAVSRRTIASPLLQLQPNIQTESIAIEVRENHAPADLNLGKLEPPQEGPGVTQKFQVSMISNGQVLIQIAVFPTAMTLRTRKLQQGYLCLSGARRIRLREGGEDNECI